MQNIFYDIALIIIIATIGGYIAKILRQPLIPVYIVVGIILGPVMGLITDSNVISTLSELGIAFLLFIVGLELDFRRLKEIGSIATFGTIMQFLIMFIIGFFISLGLNYNYIISVYMGLFLAFSSTMVVVKLLSDKKELETLHGRIVVGILLMQDILAILALTILYRINEFSAFPVLGSLFKALLLIVGAVLLSKFIFPKIFEKAADTPQLLFLVSLTVCFLFATLFSYIGFSIVVGAFIAGVTLGNLPYNFEIIGRVNPLKDFFSVLFFVSIGLQLVFSELRKIIIPFLIFSFVVLLIKPFVTILICSLFGYKKRTSFNSSLSLAEVSEFSLIIAVQGLALNHINHHIFTLILFVAIFTMAVASYYIKFDNWLYYNIGSKFRFIDKINPNKRELVSSGEDYNYNWVLVGADRIGYSIMNHFKNKQEKFIIVDFNPDVIRRLKEEHIHYIYGDIADPEIIERLNWNHVHTIISTVPGREENLLLIKKVREKNSDINILVTASFVEDALSLYDAGADYVILPHYLGGEHVSVLLESVSNNLDKLIDTKLGHIKELKIRKDIHKKHK
ncbi:cation:proton antiporter [Candidatus Woesearchaeota archaeon]|nr:cation:proton antiporter [Candidatus Woesearchaeota archaeon]